MFTTASQVSFSHPLSPLYPLLPPSNHLNFVLFQDGFGYSECLAFQYYFRTSCNLSKKRVTILVGNALNLNINLGTTILAIVSLSIHEHGMPLSVFISLFLPKWCVVFSMNLEQLGLNCVAPLKYRFVFQ